MTLRALIIRADGVLADTDEMRRTSLNRMIADAGFNWQCDRKTYASSLSFGTSLQRMKSFFMPRLGYQRTSDDVEHLAMAMVRRTATIFSEMLQISAPVARPGVLDLIMGAKAEGLRLALATTLPERDAVRICLAALGPEACGRFDVIAATPQGATIAAPAVGLTQEVIYTMALEKLDLPAADCLVLESSAKGLEAAGSVNLRALVIRSAHPGNDPMDRAVFVADDVPALIGLTGNSRLDPLTRQQRSDLIAALQRLHAGHSGPEGGSERSSVMRVANILQSKGSSVKTITADATVRELSRQLSTDSIGAVVVVSSGGRLAGIISERDVARGLADHGAALPALPVSQLMTKGVVTCAPDDSIASISKIMTQRRIRHLPVLDGGELVGLVSIGDVLKFRLDEVQLEANVLRDYAIARS